MDNQKAVFINRFLCFKKYDKNLTIVKKYNNISLNHVQLK